MIVDNPAEYRLLKFARSKTRGKSTTPFFATSAHCERNACRSALSGMSSTAIPPDSACTWNPTTATPNGARITGPVTPERTRANSAADISAGSTCGNLPRVFEKGEHCGRSSRVGIVLNFQHLKP